MYFDCLIAFQMAHTVCNGVENTVAYDEYFTIPLTLDTTGQHNFFLLMQYA